MEAATVIGVKVIMAGGIKTQFKMPADHLWKETAFGRTD